MEAGSGLADESVPPPAVPRVEESDEYRRCRAALESRIRVLTERRVALFRQSPHAPSPILRVSKFRHVKPDVWHFRVTGSHRVWFEQRREGEEAVYVLTWVGDHSEQERRLKKMR